MYIYKWKNCCNDVAIMNSSWHLYQPTYVLLWEQLPILMMMSSECTLVIWLVVITEVQKGSYWVILSSENQYQTSTKSKGFFQLQQKTETNKKLPGLTEPINHLSANHIAQTPSEPQSWTNQKLSHVFLIKNFLTVINIFHLHYWPKEY